MPRLRLREQAAAVAVAASGAAVIVIAAAAAGLIGAEAAAGATATEAETAIVADMGAIGIVRGKPRPNPTNRRRASAIKQSFAPRFRPTSRKRIDGKMTT